MGAGISAFQRKEAFTPFHSVLENTAMKWINTRFPEQLYDQVTAAANAQERTFGIVMRVNISPDKSRVIWLQPGRSKSAGEVTLAVADEANGSIAWTFGDGRLKLDTFPYACNNDRAI